MKFMRRPDLDSQTRIHIVMLIWLHQGVYGKMTQIAAYYRISRTFLYQLVIAVAVAPVLQCKSPQKQKFIKECFLLIKRS